MSRKIDKALVLKRLFEQQSVFTDPAGTPEERKAQAEALMDKLVGPRWRTEINADMELVENLKKLPSTQEVREFWGDVQLASDDAGFGYSTDVQHDPPQDEEDPQPTCGCPTADPRIVQVVQRILGKLKIGHK